MYVKRVEINNIRSIAHFEMEFSKPAGWHVLIGDNGAGKTTVVRAIALALIGDESARAIRLPLESWLKRSTTSGAVKLGLLSDINWDGESDQVEFLKNLTSRVLLIKTREMKLTVDGQTKELGDGVTMMLHTGDGKVQYKNWGHNGWLSTGFGPFRRFSGGNAEVEKLFKSHPRVGAHLSLFGEDVALTEALEWVKDLDYLRLKEKELGDNGQEDSMTFHNVIKFVNESRLLPHGVTIQGVDKNGIQFKDGNGTIIDSFELSDGYRSILSLTLELIRQLVRVYGASNVFREIAQGIMQISLPGVVLIDEIDAHLHPSWQTSIGQWFTQYFPGLQFIVTTHSPLVCRACDKGSIWRLAAPGSDDISGEIIGLEKDRLVYGNILDAYGTEIFGENTVRSAKANEKLRRLGTLNIRAALGQIEPAEERERSQLQKVLSTDDPTGF